MSTEPQEVPLSVRVQLGHAAVQTLADRAGVDLLHVKGFALDEALRFPGRVGTDVDVLVRPRQVAALITAMEQHGWSRSTGFAEGSSWEHAATYSHPVLGYADIHRHFPGLGVAPADAFARLWTDRIALSIAGRAMAAPSRAAQGLLLLLHAGKAPREANARRDIDHVWFQQSPEFRNEVMSLVTELDAGIGLASALGTLDDFRDHREYRHWSVSSRGGTRLDEWRARIVAEPTLRGRIRLFSRVALVNVDHLAVRLGRRPTATEIVAEFFGRLARGIAEEWRRRRPHG